MKFINLYIILSLFVCYTGICENIRSFWVSNNQANSHCSETQVKNTQQTSLSLRTDHNDNSKDSSQMSCCNYSVLKSYYPTDIKNLPDSIVYTNNLNVRNYTELLNSSIKLDANLYAPPELYLLKSSFLL
jgi:ferritin-like protein